MHRALLWLLPIVALVLPSVILGYGTMVLGMFENAAVFAAVVLVRTLVLAAGAIIAGRFFYIHVVKERELGRKARDIATMYYALFFLLAALEFGATFVVQSVAHPFAFSQNQWCLLHWGPLNHEGYRDDEFVNDKKKLAIVVGDSFSAGLGIADHRDRFGDLLDAATEYRVWNMGINGSATKDELRRIRELAASPVTPGLIILQYFINDIEGSGHALGKAFEPRILAPRTRLLIQSSYLLNTIYCRVFTMDNPAVGYENYIRGLVNDDAVWRDHVRDLADIQRTVRSLNARLLVVIFPLLEQPEKSREYTDKLSAAFNALHIEYIDVAEYVETVRPADRVVNRYDGHPSERVHKLVADAVIGRLNPEGIAQGN